MEKKYIINWCLRTGRPCIGGAYDGEDGWGVDCASQPSYCPFYIHFCLVDVEEEEEEEI